MSDHGHDAQADHDAHEGHGSDDHGHDAPAEQLGAVDTQAWAAAIGGSVLAIIVVVALALTVSG